MRLYSVSKFIKSIILISGLLFASVLSAESVKSAEFSFIVKGKDVSVSETIVAGADSKMVRFGFIKAFPLKIKISDKDSQDIKYKFNSILKDGVGQDFELKDKDGFTFIKVSPKAGQPSVSDVSRYELNYLVKNAVIESEAVGALDWYIFNRKRSVDTDKLSVKVYFPEEADIQQSDSYLKVINLDEQDEVDGKFRKEVINTGRLINSFESNEKIAGNEIVILSLTWKKSKNKTILPLSTGRTIKLD